MIEHGPMREGRTGSKQPVGRAVITGSHCERQQASFIARQGFRVSAAPGPRASCTPVLHHRPYPTFTRCVAMLLLDTSYRDGGKQHSTQHAAKETRQQHSFVYHGTYHGTSEQRQNKLAGSDRHTIAAKPLIVVSQCLGRRSCHRTISSAMRYRFSRTLRGAWENGGYAG